MVVKGTNGDGEGKKTEKNLFIGRDSEINEILDTLKDNKSNNGTRLLLVGESGIGKSALLDEIHRRLTEEEDHNRPFVGYYSKKESQITESGSLIYPFRTVLEKLVNNIKESQELGEKIDSTLARVKKGLLKFGKEQGIKIGVAIIEDVANKVGLKETLDVGRDILKAVGSQKTSMMLAQQYIADHRDEARQSYLEIFKAIADEFKERRFVLIFDQFESVGKASTDFFLNFVKFLEPQERFDILVSFRTDDTTWNDSATRKVYEDLKRKMIYDLDAKKISIEGLSAEDIGKWIKQVRGMSLPLIPDLQRIRENSAGLPLLLDEWIRSSRDLKDYDNIKRNKFCTQIIGLEEGLKDPQDQVRLDRMCILLYPLKDERLGTYLEMNGNADLVTGFVKELSKNRIFNEDLEWFRHELVKKCFEDRLGNKQVSYHQRAAKFFEGLQVQEKQGDEVDKEEGYSISISRAYHFHMAGDHENSFTYNKEVAKYACKIGDLDTAERCYKRAIADAKCLGRLQDEMDCLLDMTNNVYHVWARYEEALSSYQSLLKYYDSADDSSMRAGMLNNIASVHEIRAEYEKAMELYNQSLEIASKVGDQRLIGTTLSNIALILTLAGEYEKAMELYNQSLEISKHIGNQDQIAYTLISIAMIHNNKGEYEQALELYNQSLEISKQLGDQRLIGTTLNSIASIHYRKGEYEKAMELLDQSLEISKQLGDQRLIGMILNSIASIHYRKGEYEKAMELLDQSLEISRHIGNQDQIPYTLNNIALLLDGKAEHEQALELYDQSLNISKQLGDLYMIGLTLNNIALLHYNKGEYEEALSHALEAYGILERLKSPELDKSVEILSDIKQRVGSEAYERLVEKVERDMHGSS